MKYSELKPIIKLLRKHGWKKAPHESVYEKRWNQGMWWQRRTLTLWEIKAIRNDPTWIFEYLERKVEEQFYRIVKKGRRI